MAFELVQLVKTIRLLSNLYYLSKGWEERREGATFSSRMLKGGSGEGGGNFSLQQTIFPLFSGLFSTAVREIKYYYVTIFCNTH